MRKAFKYRLYPNPEQEAALSKMLETHRHLYNDALAERKNAFETEGRTIKYVDQSAHLKAERFSNPYLADTNFSSCQATLRRLDKAFQAFFRRVKIGEEPGYPRFKGRDRFDSVEFPSYGDGCKIKGSRIRFQFIGDVKMKFHRPIEGNIKTVSFKREVDKWYVVFSCELPDSGLSPSDLAPVGIDLGLKAFLVSSDGEVIPPPKLYRKAQVKLRRLQRAVARKKKGSRRRRKSVVRLAKFHRKISNQRKDFHHKTALALIKKHGLIVHEDLNVKGIAKSRLAKSTHDVGWGQFLVILHSKAEEAGIKVIAVNPRNTTQACSVCGSLPKIPITLKDREYRCSSCGQVSDRDFNAAKNVLRLGLSLQRST